MINNNVFPHPSSPSTCSPPVPQGPTTSRRHPIRDCRSAWPVTAWLPWRRAPPLRHMNTSSSTVCRWVWRKCLFSVFVCKHQPVCLFVYPRQTDSLCSSDGVIIQTVTSDSASSDSLSQTQLVVETEGRSQDDQLEATSLLEGSENVVMETQEPMRDGFSDKVKSSAHSLFLNYGRRLGPHLKILSFDLFFECLKRLKCEFWWLKVWIQTKKTLFTRGPNRLPFWISYCTFINVCVCQQLVHSGIPSGGTVLIVSPPNISSTLTGNRLWKDIRAFNEITFGSGNLSDFWFLKTTFSECDYNVRSDGGSPLCCSSQIRSWRTRKDPTDWLPVAGDAAADITAMKQTLLLPPRRRHATRHGTRDHRNKTCHFVFDSSHHVVVWKIIPNSFGFFFINPKKEFISRDNLNSS